MWWLQCHPLHISSLCFTLCWKCQIPRFQLNLHNKIIGQSIYLYKLHINNIYQIIRYQCSAVAGGRWLPRLSRVGGWGWKDGVAVVVVFLTVVEDDEALIIQTSCEDSELHSLQLFE